MYDRNTPINQFIEEFNILSATISEFNERYQGMVEQINFINSTVLPRYSGRPAIFETVEAMSQSDVLVRGDICLTFNQGTEENQTKFIEAYRIELISERPGDTYTALKDNALGAFLIPTSGTAEQIMAQINNVNTSLVEFKNTKGKMNGLAELDTDGKVPSTQLPAIDIPKVSPVTTTDDGLMKSTDYVDFKKLPIPTDVSKYVLKQKGADDFNLVTETGMYFMNTKVNAPVTTLASWALIVTNANSLDNANYVQQIAINKDNTAKIYIRTKNSTTWSNWETYNAFTDSHLNKLGQYDHLSSVKKNVYAELKNTSFDNITVPGLYAVTNPSNKPPNAIGDNFRLLVLSSKDLSGSNVQQMALSETDQKRIYIRRKTGTTWGNWEEFNIYTTDEKAKLGQYDALDNVNKNAYIRHRTDIDFNDLRQPGIYSVAAIANKPPGANTSYFSVVVLNTTFLSGDFVQQIAIEEKQENRIFMRRRYDGVWGAWTTFNVYSAEEKTKLGELNYTRAMTQAQYDALSTAEKNRTDVWYGIYEE
ncbi:MAG: hypothetical protein GXZ11_01285 [Tissierellia bacterium]|nr:hypothetical protein [Tissierellia bacterium]